MLSRRDPRLRIRGVPPGVFVPGAVGQPLLRLTINPF
jgi:hypothetical protein